MTEHRHPKESEDEFFLFEEMNKRRKYAIERRKRMAAEEREELRRLHWMRCPKCGDELHVVKMRDLEMSRCFNCGAVVLDEHEMKKLVGGNGKKVTEAVLNMFRK